MPFCPDHSPGQTQFLIICPHFFNLSSQNWFVCSLTLMDCKFVQNWNKYPHLSAQSWVAVACFEASGYACSPVETPDLVGVLLRFAKSACGTPACMLFCLSWIWVVYLARQFHWKLNFVFAMRLLLVFSFPASDGRCVSFSTNCVSNIVKFVWFEIKLWRLRLFSQLLILLLVLLLLVSVSPRIVSAIFCVSDQEHKVGPQPELDF